MLVLSSLAPCLLRAGTAILDKDLIKRGLLAELAGVGMCVLIGFVVGLVVSGW